MRLRQGVAMSCKQWFARQLLADMHWACASVFVVVGGARTLNLAILATCHTHGAQPQMPQSHHPGSKAELAPMLRQRPFQRWCYD
jgi:hypothetical protein